MNHRIALVGIFAVMLFAGCQQRSNTVVLAPSINITQAMIDQGHELDCISNATVQRTNISTSGLCVKKCLGIDTFCGVAYDTDDGANKSNYKYYYLCTNM